MNGHRAIWVFRGTVFVILAALLTWCGIEYLSSGFHIDRDIAACRVSGFGAIGFLAATLLVPSCSVFARLLRRPIRQDFSRDCAKTLGWASALLALCHAIVGFTTYLAFDWRALYENPAWRSGATAVIVLWVLLLSSSKKVVRLIRLQLWKPLHRAIYFVPLLALHHMLLLPYASRPLTMLLFAIFFALFLVKFVPVPKRTQADVDFSDRSASS